MLDVQKKKRLSVRKRRQHKKVKACGVERSYYPNEDYV